jgi:hypothetical protein
MFQKIRLLKILSTILPLVLVPLSFASGTATASSGFSFTTFELGRFDLPNVSCPGVATNCWNVNAEPQIRSDPAGNLYASSEYLPRVAICSNNLDVLNPQCGGTGAWKSSDNGLHYATLPSPNSLTAGCSTSYPCTTHFSPYGGDTDVATASGRNSNGFYNVYIISLERATGPLLTVEESTSKDGGQTWSINPTSIQAPLNDRPWVAADGANKVCVSSHNVATGFNILVSCSYDAGLTFPQVASAFDANHIALFEGQTQIGSLAIDPHSHVIYQVFDSAVVNTNELSMITSYHSVWVGVSIDGGKSFTDYPVYINPDVLVGYNHQFSQVSVDKAGNVYAVYTDDHNVYYSFSTDFGKDWKGPIQVNSSPSNTAIFPWSSAGSAGKLDIAWYGTSFFDGKTVPDNYPSTAAWYVYFAQVQQALTTTPTVAQTAATAIIHYGGVCEAGVTCSGNRDLFDDFGVAASPTTGMASIVFSADQFVNTPAEPSSPTCDASKTNTASCDHTDIATQTTGPGIFQKHKGFEVEGRDLETSDSGHPEMDLAISNTDTQAITSVSVLLAGANLALNWNPSRPILPGATTSASTTALQSFSLVLGGVYVLTITATMADGSTFTQTFSVIYTPLIGPF